MKSLRLGKFQGISLELHSTFILLILAIVIILAITDLAILLPTIILLFFLFLSVFVHELFHSLVAISKGSKVTKIILLPIGGLSMMEDIPEKPMDEFLTAIAGPAFNFALAFLIIILVSIFPQLPWPWEILASENVLELFDQAVLFYPLFGLFWVNFILGAFNLFVPALPMDGGRILRSLLAMKFGFVRATRIASKVSTFLAIFLFIFGFFFNWILMIIAVFIYLGASFESESAAIKEVLKDVPITDLIHPRPVVMDSNITIYEAYDLMFRMYKTKFLVLLKDRLAYVNADMLARVEPTKWKNTKISGIAKPLVSAKPTDDAAKLMLLTITRSQPFIPIMRASHLLGVVYEEELLKLYKLKKLREN